MPIKPIDYQVIIPKMSEVSRITNDAQQKGLILQQQDKIKQQEKIDNNLKQVYYKEDVQHGRISDKQEKDLSEGNKKKEIKKAKIMQQKKSKVELI